MGTTAAGGLRRRADRRGLGEVGIREGGGEEGFSAGAGGGAVVVAGTGDAGDASRRRLAGAGPGSAAGDALGVGCCWFLERRKVVFGSGTAAAREGMIWPRW